MENITGQRIRQLRRELDLSQEELSKKIKVTTSAVGQYETGNKKPSYDTLCRLADVFDVTTDYLLGRTGHPNTVRKYDIPDELKTLGIAYLEVAKYMQDKSIPAEDTQKIIDALEALNVINTNNKKTAK